MRSLLEASATLALLVGGMLSHSSAENLYVANQIYDGNAVGGFIGVLSATGADLGSFSPDGNLPFGVAFDKSGDLYVSLYQDNVIRKFSPSGVDLGVFASANLNNPAGIAFDARGNLYVDNYADSSRPGYIEEFSPTGTDLGRIASGTFDYWLAIDSSGNLYVDGLEAVPGTRSVHKYSPSGADLGTFGAAVFTQPSGLAFDSSGNLFAADIAGANLIREISPTGADLGIFASTGIDNPRGIAFDAAGNLYVVNEGNNTIREFSPTGTDLGNFATAGLSGPLGLAFSPSVSPEPSTFALLGVGAVGLLAYGLRRRRPFQHT
jgi:DNA-binding beta-propeller fold protein YncE